VSLRSLLFAPATEEHRLERAFAAGADGVIADLEDSVAPDAKPSARAVVERVLPRADPRAARLLRINGVETEDFAEDLELARRLELDAIVLPKATPEAVVALGGSGPPVLAIIETSGGLQLAAQIAGCGRVAALALGAVDLRAELGLEARPDELEILYARSKLVIASGAAGIRSPFDVVHLDFWDLAGLERSSRTARSLGFGGKLCIHPGQVPVVNRVFTPTDAELSWARRVVDAYAGAAESGRGVLALDGQMIDRPVVERARRMLEESRHEKGGSNDCRS
jgi:(S)-citramalyl-CoA lyase